MVTREVGRDRLVSFWLSKRESFKRRREEERSHHYALTSDASTYVMIHENLYYATFYICDKENIGLLTLSIQ
jgi:hypothetical protein